MSLAFALVAAINGSTGSRATLSCGLLGPSLVGVSPAAPRFSLLRGGGASRQSHCPEISRDFSLHGWRRSRPRHAVAQMPPEANAWERPSAVLDELLG